MLAAARLLKDDLNKGSSTWSVNLNLNADHQFDSWTIESARVIYHPLLVAAQLLNKALQGHQLEAWCNLHLKANG
jgi:hypothetical protein